MSRRFERSAAMYLQATPNTGLSPHPPQSARSTAGSLDSQESPRFRAARPHVSSKQVLPIEQTEVPKSELKGVFLRRTLPRLENKTLLRQKRRRQPGPQLSARLAGA